MDGDGVLDIVVLNESWNQFDREGFLIGRPVAPKALTAYGRRIPMSKYKFPVPADAPREAKFYQTGGLLSYADVDRDGRAEAYLFSSQSDIWWEQQLQHFISFATGKRSLRPQPPAQQLGITSLVSVSKLL
jgi:hypothetical protein